MSLWGPPVSSRYAMLESRFLSCKLYCNFIFIKHIKGFRRQSLLDQEYVLAAPGIAGLPPGTISTGWSTPILGWTCSHWQCPSMFQSSHYRMRLVIFLPALNCDRFFSASARLPLHCVRKAPHLTFSSITSGSWASQTVLGHCHEPLMSIKASWLSNMQHCSMAIPILVVGPFHTVTAFLYMPEKHQ